GEGAVSRLDGGLLVVLRARPRVPLPRRAPAAGGAVRSGERLKGSPVSQPLVNAPDIVSPQERATARTAPGISRFVDLVADKLIATEAIFRHHLDSDVPFIHQAGDYINKGGGKRVRPALLLLTARLLGHDGDEEVTYGAVIEFIHTATLIHDDIIDHAALRR